MDILNGKLFKEMLQNGSNLLTNRHVEIDALNVFPVPDGDTGTNMHLTFSAGTKDAVNTLSEYVGDIAKALSKGLLMGARGNSGVILSQIFRGFYQGVEGLNEVDVLTLAKAFVKGSEVAYRSVMKPVEGTILTVIRESSYMAQKYAEDHPEATLIEYFDYFIAEAKNSLDYTPELLPVLKEVGVVDSGGAGLLVILEGFKEALVGNKIELSQDVVQQEGGAQLNMESEEFGYCTEFIIRLSENGFITFTEDKLKKALARLGNSIVVVQDEDIVKVHVHTLTPGEALNLGQRYGEFVKLKIENMQEQHENILTSSHAAQQDAPKPKAKYALIAVAAGEGLTKYFKDLRVDVVISGGQTMNPSTEDFVAAVKEVNADHIILLPNNSNIVLAAQQAATVLEEYDITVLPTKTIPQGLSACILFNPDVDLETNVAEMTEAIEHVKTGQITYAIKDTTYEGKEISAGDYMGLLEKDIVVNDKDKLETTKALIDQAIFEDAEIVTVIVGSEATVEEEKEVEEYIADKYDVEVEVIEGGQPVYSFIFGVE